MSRELGETNRKYPVFGADILIGPFGVLRQSRWHLTALLLPINLKPGVLIAVVRHRN